MSRDDTFRSGDSTHDNGASDSYYKGFKAGVKAEAEQQAIRLRDWMLDPSYGTYVGPKGSTCDGGPFRDHAR